MDNSHIFFNKKILKIYLEIVATTPFSCCGKPLLKIQNYQEHKSQKNHTIKTSQKAPQTLKQSQNITHGSTQALAT
jgi:hypothetical protein